MCRDEVSRLPSSQTKTDFVQLNESISTLIEYFSTNVYWTINMHGTNNMLLMVFDVQCTLTQPGCMKNAVSLPKLGQS